MESPRYILSCLSSYSNVGVKIKPLEKFYSEPERLRKSWVIFRKILVRVSIVHRRVRVTLRKQLAIRLTIYVVVGPSVGGKVGRLMNKGSSL